MIKNVNRHSCMDRRIDEIRVRENDRQVAKVHMRDADVVAEIFSHAVEKLRSGWEALAHLFAKHAR